MKSKKCRNCSEKFNPYLSTQVVCSPKCATEYAKQKIKEKKDKEFHERKRKLKHKDIGIQRREAVKAFNAYIRHRDRNDGCISCGVREGVQFHAGHYKTRGAHPELAFTEDNCHRQCAQCNNYRSGNIVDYRQRLKKKVGRKRLLELESYHPPVKRTAKDYRDIKNKYRKKLKELKLFDND